MEIHRFAANNSKFCYVNNRREGWTQGWHSRGVLHGTARRFGPARARGDNLRTAASFAHGAPEEGRGAVAWRGLIGGGFLACMTFADFTR